MFSVFGRNERFFGFFSEYSLKIQKKDNNNKKTDAKASVLCNLKRRDFFNIFLMYYDNLALICTNQGKVCLYFQTIR
jgi:hypothetical protein